MRKQYFVKTMLCLLMAAVMAILPAGAAYADVADAQLYAWDEALLTRRNTLDLPIEELGIIDVAGGIYHTLILTDDGRS